VVEPRDSRSANEWQSPRRRGGVVGAEEISLQSAVEARPGGFHKRREGAADQMIEEREGMEVKAREADRGQSLSHGVRHSRQQDMGEKPGELDA